MSSDWLREEARDDLRVALGYLNFSSGATDPKFLAALNRLFSRLAATDAKPVWSALGAALRSELERLAANEEAFRSCEQATAVLRLAFEHVLPAYREFHADLLWNHSDESLFQPFFIGRMCEAVLVEGGPWDETDRVVTGAIKRLNDYVGYRPIATLETKKQHEPYPHERVRPIPIHITEVGAAHGPYKTLIEKALQILRDASPEIRRQACFQPDALDELAIDPRAYDFDHPVNRRPNYHFGLWDPDCIGENGDYCRFVLQQVTLDGLLARVDAAEEDLREQRLFEAAGVLAGTMLMGAGVSGDRPDSHDSETTLATLMPVIAAYRDHFYQDLLEQAPSEWRDRLLEESRRMRQPFGGVRQDLNQYLATQRADQLARVSLARLFAQIGYAEAASSQADTVAVASTRMRCDMDCRITQAHREIDRGRLLEAAALLPEIDDLLQRAIQCGAVVDPWNILGFGAQFSLFPAIENTVHDHRVDDLIDLMNDIFGLHARLQKEAAASGESQLQGKLSDQLSELADWWDQFASAEVSGIEGFSGEAAWQSTATVATALRAWHQAGTAAGDIRFWSQHVEHFSSPKAYSLVVDALLEQGDLVAAMALLTRWLSESPEIALTEGGYSFHALAVRWMASLWQNDGDEMIAATRSPLAAKASITPPEERWPLTRKFLDFIEANAEDNWDVAEFLLELPDDEELDALDDEAVDDLPTGVDETFRAAYENVTYSDSTDDGVDGDMDQGKGGPRFDDDDDFELAPETDRISENLAFHITLAKLWKFGSLTPDDSPSPEASEVRGAWLARALENWDDLLQLLEDVDRYRVPTPRGTTEALLEYDRQRGMKEILLDRIVWTCVEIADAVQLIQATLDDEATLCELADWEEPVARIFRAIFREDVQAIREHWPTMLTALAEEPLLYVPTSRGGDPHRIVASRCMQQILGRLLEYVPRLGLLTETFQLLETIHRMEQDHPVGPGAITEFDHLFEIGCKGIVECLVESSEDWEVQASVGRSAERKGDLSLVECVEQATEQLLRCWLGHSRGIRISVLESIGDQRHWKELKGFIGKYGEDLFTQHFMNFGNLRAILHEGVDIFLESLMEVDDPEIGQRLIEDIQHGDIDRATAAAWLELTLEAVAENYSEYIDYNSTTTQSDRGEMLYMFLDFLRLQSSYDRVAWNLKPVFLAHEVMVRKRRDRAASLWQAAVARRSSEVADNHMKLYETLSDRYGMWLPCVRERLSERFVRPLEIDRMCAWVRPAIEESSQDDGGQAFAKLYEAIKEFLSEPSSVGFEIPSWLESLQNEMYVVRNRPMEDLEPHDPTPQIDRVHLPLNEVYRQIEEW